MCSYLNIISGNSCNDGIDGNEGNDIHIREEIFCIFCHNYIPLFYNAFLLLRSFSKRALTVEYYFHQNLQRHQRWPTIQNISFKKFSFIYVSYIFVWKNIAHNLSLSESDRGEIIKKKCIVWKNERIRSTILFRDVGNYFIVENLCEGNCWLDEPLSKCWKTGAKNRLQA